VEHLTTGVVAATLTPIEESGKACIDLLAQHCRDLLQRGCSAIVLLGTTGEANSFSVDERRAILAALIDAGIDPRLLIVGTGCCARTDTIALTRHALSLGVERVLVLPPFYYKSVTDEGIVDAYVRTIEAIANDRLRLYLYKIPQVSGVDISAGVISTLLSRYGRVIAGVKDSSGDEAALLELCARFGASLDVLAGSEQFLPAALRSGASGCVSATANAYAEWIVELYATPDDPALHDGVVQARKLFERYPLIAALKAFEARRGGDVRWRNVLPPLQQLARSREEQLFADFDRLGLGGAARA